MHPRAHPILLAALVAGASYCGSRWVPLPLAWHVAWKGAGVALLALWAAFSLRDRAKAPVVAILALGAAGDVLLETHGLVVGAVAFLAGHVLAALFYARAVPSGWRPWAAMLVAVTIAALAWGLPADRAAAPGIALYALGLGAMTGCAWVSRFPLAVKLGAALFATSDLLLLARMGPLAGSALPDILVWPSYFAGQILIAWGVVTAPATALRKGNGAFPGKGRGSPQAAP